jgi:hypothetical protein
MRSLLRSYLGSRRFPREMSNFEVRRFLHAVEQMNMTSSLSKRLKRLRKPLSLRNSHSISSRRSYDALLFRHGSTGVQSGGTTGVKLNSRPSCRVSLPSCARSTGPVGLVFRRCQSTEQKPPGCRVEAKVSRTLRQSYPDFGSTLAADSYA